MASSLRDLVLPDQFDLPAADPVADPGAPAASAGLQRGLRSALVSQTANSYLSDALNAEAAGDVNGAAALRQQAAAYQEEAAGLAPRVSALRDVHGVGDAVEYAQGMIGAGAASAPQLIAGGVAARFVPGLRSLSPGLASGIGGAAAAVPSTYEANIAEQQLDPTIAALPANQRRESALKSAVQENALMVPLAGVAGAAGRLLEAPAANAAAQALRVPLESGAQGALAAKVAQANLSELNPNRDTSHDAERVLEAGVGGAIGAAPFAVPGLVKDTLGNPAAEAARKGMDTAKEKLGPTYDAMQERVKRAVNTAREKGDELKTEFDDANTPEEFAAAKFGNLRDSMRTFIDGDAAPAYAEAGTDAQKIKDLDAERVQGGEKIREEILNSDAADQLKERVQKYDLNTPEGQNALRTAYKGMEAANRLKSWLSDGEQYIRDARGKILKDSGGDQKSRAAYEAAPEEMQALFGSLKPEFQKNQEILKELPRLGLVLRQFLARTGELSEAKASDPGDIQGLSHVRGILSYFKKPGDVIEAISGLSEASKAAGEASEPNPKAEALQRAKDALRQIAEVPSAEADARNRTGFLYNALPEGVRGYARDIGEFIDRTSDPEQRAATLEKVVGDRALANRIAQYYEPRTPTGERATPTRNFLYDDNLIDKRAGKDEEGQQLTSTYAYDNAKTKRPFYIADEGKGRTDATARFKENARRAGFSDANGRLIPMNEYLAETGEKPDAARASLLKSLTRERAAEAKNLEKTAKEGSKLVELLKKQESLADETSGKGMVRKVNAGDPGETKIKIDKARADYARRRDNIASMDRQLRDLGNENLDANAALSKYHMGKFDELGASEARATDDALQRYKRVLFAGGKNESPESAAAREGTRIDFIRNGKKESYSAESIWKSTGDTLGTKGGESAEQRMRRLFSDGVSGILARPDVEGFADKEQLKNLVLDRDTGTRLYDERKTEKQREFADKVDSEFENTGFAQKTRQRADELIEAGNLDHIEDAIHEIDKRLATLQQKMNERKEGEGFARGMWSRQARELREARYTLDSHLREDAFQREYEDTTNTDARTKESTDPRYYDEFTGETLPAYKRAKSTPIQSLSYGDDVPEADLKSKFSKENKQRTLTQQEMRSINDEVVKMRGPDITVAFRKSFKDVDPNDPAPASYNAQKRLIRLAVTALDARSQAHHEAMHDFVATLSTLKGDRRLKQDILDVGSSMSTKAQLRELLKGYPQALKDALADPNEAVAYAFQFWQAKKFNVVPEKQGVFQSIAKFIRESLGIMTQDERVQQVFQSLADGELAEPSVVSRVLADKNAVSLRQKFEEIAPPIANGVEKIFDSAIQRIHNKNVEALSQIADIYHTPAGREEGKGLGLLQARGREAAKRINGLADLVAGKSEADMQKALTNLQSMKAAKNPLEKGIRSMLDEMHIYMDKAGVERLINGEWKKIPKVADYFPRVWDFDRIDAQREQAMKDFASIGMDRAAFENFVTAVKTSVGTGELADNKNHPGFTPYNQAVNERMLKIDKSNAALFAKYQKQDLVQIMTTYIQQAAHRAEYAKRIGNDGEKIAPLISKAKSQGATDAEINDTLLALQGMNGTIGHDMNAKAKNFMAGVVTLENMALLPFSLFSNLVDPLGISLRTGEAKEGWKAFGNGVKGVLQAFRKDTDPDTELAKTIGIIDSQNMLDTIGNVYNGVYMNKWLRKGNDLYFKLNGMEEWNKRMRVSAMGAGMRFMDRHARRADENSQRYMRELGLQKGDVQALKDGRIKTSTEEGLSAEQEQRVQEALYKFVDSAIVRPNAADRPVWGSDPHWMLAFHLKQFNYSFQNVMLKRVAQEMNHGNAAPLMALAAYVPAMMAADLLRGNLTGSVQTGGSMWDILARSAARSGVMGVGTFGADAITDVTRGNLPGTSFLGPAANHVLMAADTAFGNTSGSDLLYRTVPAGAALKHF